MTQSNTHGAEDIKAENAKQAHLEAVTSVMAEIALPISSAASIQG